MSARREGRAIWMVLGLLVAAGLLGLLLQGLVSRLPETPSLSGARPTSTAAVGGGGPLLVAGSAGRPLASRLPAHVVALTFDDGPSPALTPAVLAILKRFGVPATFFVSSRAALRSPGLLAAERAQGEEIGLNVVPASKLALSAGQLALAGAIGETTSLVRPPTTSPDRVNRSEISSVEKLVGAGYTAALFDRNGGDTGTATAGEIVKHASATTPSGAVVLLHDGVTGRAAMVRALPRIIAHYRANGYRFVTVSGATGGRPLAALSPVGGLRHLQGVAFGAALAVSSWGVAALWWLVLVFAAMTLVRLVVLVSLAHHHARRAERARALRRSIPAHGRSMRARASRRRRSRGTPVEYPPVTVIVPAYNEAVGIEAAIRSLVASDYPAFDVVVVDDGSTDGTAEIVECMGLSNVRVVRKANGGKARALTTGLTACESEIVVMVDGDTVFEPEALRRLVEPLSNPAVGAVSGNTKVGNRRGLIGRWQHLEYVSAFNLERRLYDLWHCMPTVPGAIGAFRRRALLAVGGVSDDTLAEDTDLTMALHRAGWRVVYQDDARAWTEAPARLGQLWRQRYRWCYGTLQAVWKHRRVLIKPGLSPGLGRIGLPSLLLFQVVLPVIGPAIDLYAIYGLVFLNPVRTVTLWLVLVFIQAVITAYALHLDGERWRTLWALPLQQFVYRQLMYLVVIQSVVSAMGGIRLRWHTVPRTGELQAPGTTPVPRSATPATVRAVPPPPTALEPHRAAVS